MNRKEKIYSYINSAEYIPLSYSELMLVLDVPQDDEGEFSSILAELEAEGRIFVSKKGRYAPSEKNGIITGVFRCNPRGMFGFVTPESGDDVYISSEDFYTAIDGDKVLVALKKHSGRKKEGKITKVLERGSTTLTAVMCDDFVATCDNPRILKNILLREVRDAKKGDRVILEITEFAPSGKLYGEVVSVLGSSRELSSYSEAIVFSNGVRRDFPEDVISCAEAVPDSVSTGDTAGREDLSDKIIFTIDGEDARDFDDAVSLEYTSGGNFLLGVHIADVTHYVTENSPLDQEAYLRATSVYLTNRVIPMLPERLSNGICSLNPNVNRLALSVFMEIDKAGNVINHRLSKTIIRSKYRMTYNEVAKILDGDKELIGKYSDIHSILADMHRLSAALFEKRTERGSINFDFPESKVILSPDGLSKEVSRIERNDAHKLIEEFMLIANETIAEYAFWADLPFVYRVHDEPDDEKMDSFRRFIGGFGLFIKGNEVYPKDLQAILDQIKGTEDEMLISTYMLRSLMKAEYKSTNDGHFGLASKYYCHFTSPIRRYPDLLIHRILKAYISGQDVMHYADFVDKAAAQSSDAEKRAEKTEREVGDLYKCAYMEGFVGAVFPATISGITDFGIFAELDNTIEGLIRLETIEDDYYEYIEEERLLIGKRKHKTYAVGDHIEIEVVRSDIRSRQIDFVLKGTRSRKPSQSGSRKFRQFTKKNYKSKRK